MATRFYAPHPSGAPAAPVSPAFDAAWDQTTEATRHKIQTRRVNTPKAIGLTVTETSSSALNVLRFQFVSAPIAAQTISGTAKGMIPSQESSATADARAQLGVRVVSNDGTTVRGTLLALSGAGLANEFTTAAAPYEAKKYPVGWTGAGAALTPVDAQAGDRLVWEIGARFHNSSASAFLARWMLGDDVGLVDISETEGDTVGNGWLELSQTIVFAPDYTVTTDSIDATTYAGTYLEAIDDAGVNCDVLELAAGTYTGGAYAQTTTRSKYLRIRPAPGVSREQVLLQGFGSDPWFTNANWVSFENVTFTGSQKFKGHLVQFIGCRHKAAVQIREGSRNVTVQGGRLGGESGAHVAMSGVYFSGQLGDPIQDVWILGNDMGYINVAGQMGQDLVECRAFDHVVIDRNYFHDVFQPAAPNDHTDAVRSYLGGTYWVVTNNVWDHDTIDAQGLFVNGGKVTDILVANNRGGRMIGTFRMFAFDDDTDRLRLINNSWPEGGSFSGGAVHTGVVMFNNAFPVGASIGRVTGTTVDWAYRDYNYLGETPTNITPAANEPITGVTFNDVAASDYRLTAASNGLNFGIASAAGVFAPTTDAEGNARSFPCEAGALERQAGDP